MGHHRADRKEGRRTRRTGGTEPTPAGGRRKATRAQRRAPHAPRALARIPALPTLVGVAALAVAGTGAAGLTAHGRTPRPTGLQLSAGSDRLSGTDAAAFAADRTRRAQAISRDAERQALEDAADQELHQQAEAQNRQRTAALASLARSAQRRAHQIAANRWVLPTEHFHLTAGFGQSSYLWSSVHTGLDFAAPSGTPIFAVADGVVSETGWAGAYGYRTIETLNDGTEIWYCHQSSIGVSTGEHLDQGETIGAVGSTGNTTGPHLHLEVRPTPDDPIDPYAALVHHGVTP
jgi:murein DD-endopeptidase MepM/ murein hydrolase activator NlpD